MNRFTFVVQIQPDGPSTIENLSTHERIRVSDLDAVGPQIREWLVSLPPETTLPTRETTLPTRETALPTRETTHPTRGATDA